ncbi:hypothetical protein [Arenimonas oryziterrae]|uniref:Uncharacterized protein n=1 Tax=Arenimonas oryziterrae DSM 21050 = YC6267 TaxID=1121015 RepID=A0A091AWN5_9GAMM|nr:hypothetical protein [Arenimonas oryziterrae]KFN44708.1 hypothetical protein N789_01465 [Arenimonas oryziterrae DSM 21050 = YC6267]
MKFPLQLSFKIIAIAPQISVTDAAGALKFYVKQKAFKLKESVKVFADTAQTRELYAIDADRVLDFNAQYKFTARDGRTLGSLRRKGMRSLWSAKYDILVSGGQMLHINEENPWIKVADAIFSDIPLVGLFSGYLFHPAYRVTRADGTQVLRVHKLSAFMEGRYQIDSTAPMNEDEQETALLSVFMMLLLERMRG